MIWHPENGQKSWKDEVRSPHFLCKARADFYTADADFCMTYAGYRHFCAQNRPNSHGMKFAHLDLWIGIGLAGGERTGAARGSEVPFN